MIISMKSEAIVNVHLMRDTKWSIWMRVFFITIMVDRIPGAQTMMVLSGCVAKDDGCGSFRTTLLYHLASRRWVPLVQPGGEKYPFF